MDYVEQFEHAGVLVRICYDEDPESPREWDNLGWMVCWHRRYNLGDWRRDQRGSPESHDGTRFESPTEFQEWWHEHGKGGVILPLYLYDHSGITISCSSFSCPWDSGQIGFVYCTREMILNEYGGKKLTKKKLEQAEKVLRQEVQTYDEFLTGQIYGYMIYALEPLESEDDDSGLDSREGEHLDSCWGHYGLEYCKEEAIASAEHESKKLKEKAEAALVADLAKI